MNVTDTRLGRYFESRRERGRDGLPTLSVTLDRGLVRRHSLERKTDTALAPQEHLMVRPGDIAYNMMRMWQGASGLVEEDALVSPAYVVLSPKEGVDPRFAAYLFKLPEMVHRFWSYSYGLTDDRLRLYYHDFRRIPGEFPPLPEQKKIVEILATWDKAIETTERLHANADTQKRALMQQLLTGRRRLSNFGGRSWPIIKLGQLCDAFSGGTPSRNHPEFFGGDIPWIKSGELNGGLVRETEEKITEVALRESSARIAPKDSILLALYGATAGVVAITCIDAAINQAILAIVPKTNVDRDYLLYSLQNKIAQMKRLVQGGQPNLNAGIVKAIGVPMPGVAEQRAIAAIIRNADQQVNVLAKRRQTLSFEKSALMQQLLTGKRRVPV